MAVPKEVLGLCAVLFTIFPNAPPRMAPTLRVSREGSSSDIWRLGGPCSAHSISDHALCCLASALGVGFRPGMFPAHEDTGTEGCLQQPGPFL